MSQITLLGTETIEPSTVTARRIVADSVSAKSYGYSDNTVFHMRLEEIENGYLLHIAFREGEVARRIFIKNFAELPDVMVAQLAARKIGV